MSCDFTYLHYRKILSNALEAGYQFTDFYHLPTGKCIYLRHDIDLLPHRAIEIARIEAKMGIRASYFFMINSPLYNIFEGYCLDIIREICLMRHPLGLHIDPDIMLHIGGGWSFDQMIDRLISAFGGMIPVGRVVSIHRPTSLVLDQKFTTISTYEPTFFSHIKYISDSAGVWREGCPCVALRESKYPQLQILTHPGLWGERDSIANILAERARLVNTYLSVCAPFL